MMRYTVKKHGKMKRRNARAEISKLALDDVYKSLLKLQNSLKENTESYLRVRVKVSALSLLAQNDEEWFTVREIMEGLLKTSVLPSGSLEEIKWEAFIRMFLYRLYKKGFLERKATIVGTLAYAYRAKKEKIRNQIIFYYTSYSEVVEEERGPYIEIEI